MRARSRCPIQYGVVVLQLPESYSGCYMRAKADRVLTNTTRPRLPLLVLAGEEQLTRL
jgi:hypothetical protein